MTLSGMAPEPEKELGVAPKLMSQSLSPQPPQNDMWYMPPPNALSYQVIFNIIPIQAQFSVLHYWCLRTFIENNCFFTLEYIAFIKQ